MDPLTVGLIAVSAGSALYNGFNQYKANQQNKSTNDTQQALTREQFEYQKSLNERVMEREDSAYQRAVSDMQNAGLNPLSLSSGSSASSMSAGSPMSAGNNSMVAPFVDPSIVASLYNARMQNATNEAIAQMQQRGVDMANAYSYDVGMANAFANQLKAFTDYERSGIKDPAVLKALKDQIIADAKNAENNARGSGTTADLLQQEYEGRTRSGTYRGESSKTSEIKDFKSLMNSVAGGLGSSTGVPVPSFGSFGSSSGKSSNGVLTRINKWLEKEASKRGSFKY